MFTEQQINILESVKVPNTYWDKKSYEYKYWWRSLYQKVTSSIVFNNLPDGWNKDFFLWNVFLLGYTCVVNTERFGLIFQPCTVSGFDIYYQPVKALISNPLYNREVILHKNAEIIKLEPDCFVKWGALDIIDFYAQKLAECTKGIDVGIINAKFPLVMTASNQSQSETLKKVYDKVQAGEPLVVWKDLTQQFDEVIPRKDPFEVWNNDYKQTYIVDRLLQDMQTILDQFYMEIGLPVTIADRKAHMLNAEAFMQNGQAHARLTCWLNTLEESIDLVNKMFGTNISVEKYEAEGDGIDYERQSDISRNGKLS